MSTRCNIVVKIKDKDKGLIKVFDPLLLNNNKEYLDKKYNEVNLNGNYISIYVHHDGYINGVGCNLYNYFNSYEKALNLCLIGDCSYIEKEIIGSYHTFYEEEWDITAPKKYDNEPECYEDFLYLYDNNQWLVKKKNSEWNVLAEHINQ